MPASDAERRCAAQRDDAVFMAAGLSVAASGSCSGGNGTHALRAVLPVSVGKRIFAARSERRRAPVAHALRYFGAACDGLPCL
uniref:Uncharacterized protein n=1 Tax=Ralstonia solanacearum CFBP2957 TaxID=859656 RepID=D8P4R1_RALSL|nr:protein of unknown function [Ralstonia solanacearum CFBP2957]